MRVLYLFLAVAGVCILIFQGGRWYEQSEVKIASGKHETKQADSLTKVEKAKVKRNIRYVEKIKIVHKSSGECLDADLPRDVWLLLPGADKHKTRLGERLRQAINRR